VVTLLVVEAESEWDPAAARVVAVVRAVVARAARAAAARVAEARLAARALAGLAVIHTLPLLPS
jgi:hypothetical protein